jgi:hypothetical protein
MPLSLHFLLKPAMEKSAGRFDVLAIGALASLFLLSCARRAA